MITNLASANSLILGFIVFQWNGSCFNKFIMCLAIIILLTNKSLKKN